MKDSLNSIINVTLNHNNIIAPLAIAAISSFNAYGNKTPILGYEFNSKPGARSLAHAILSTARLCAAYFGTKGLLMCTSGFSMPIRAGIIGFSCLVGSLAVNRGACNYLYVKGENREQRVLDGGVEFNMNIRTLLMCAAACGASYLASRSA